MAKANCNNNGKKNVVIVVITILVGWATVWGALNLQLRNLNNSIASLEKNFGEKVKNIKHDQQTHEKLVGHPDMLERVVALEENDKEIETQFKWAADITNTMFSNRDKFAQLLWKQTFGTELPPTNYWPLRDGGD